MRSETPDRVPARKLLLTLSTPLVCFMVFHVFLPLNRFPTTAFSCRPPLVRCCRESADAHKHFVENTFNSIGLFTLPLSHSFSGEIELTENQCQSVLNAKCIYIYICECVFYMIIYIDMCVKITECVFRHAGEPSAYTGLSQRRDEL